MRRVVKNPAVVLPLSMLLLPVVLASPVEGGVKQDPFSIEASLHEIPISSTGSESFEVAFGDLAAATELSGVERPEATDDIDAIFDWVGPLSGGPTPGPVFVPFGQTFNINFLFDIEGFAAELGWSLVDVDTFVEWSVPPGRFAVLTGDFDEGMFPPDLTPTSEGVVTAGEGEDFSTHLEDRTAARPLGQPLHMALDGGRLAVSASSPALTNWLAGSGPTLADDASLVAVAAALDDAGAVSAYLVRASFAFGASLYQATPEQIEELRASAVAAPFDTVGLGWTADAGQPVAFVTYAFADEATAAAMVEPLTTVYRDGTSLATMEPFSQRFSVDHVSAAGRVVTVRLLPIDNVNAGMPFRMILVRDLPFVHQ